MKKILLFKIGAIGDIIMTTPLVRQIRKNFPDAIIDYAVGSPASKVLLGNKHVDNVITFEARKSPSAFLNFISFIFKIRKNEYDAIFVFDRHWILNLTALLFGVPKRIGFDRMGKEGIFLTDKAYFDGTKHEIRYYLELGKKAGLDIDEKEVQTEIFLAKEDEEFAASLFREYKLGNSTICIAPGGAVNPGQKANIKIWPKENFAELVKKLANKNKIIIVGDKNDVSISQHIVDSVKNDNIIDLAGKTSIQQTAAIMKRCPVVICNDTGAMHIATTVSKHIISIFGPTDPKRFAPLHKESIYLWKNLPGTPCNDIYGSFKSCKNRNYTEEITPEDVLKAYEKITKKGSK